MQCVYLMNANGKYKGKAQFDRYVPFVFFELPVPYSKTGYDYVLSND